MDAPLSWRFLLLAPPPTWCRWAVFAYPRGDRGSRGWLLQCLMAVPSLLVHGSSYFWGEGDTYRTCRRPLALPPRWTF
ncbi:hypothetical protein QL285_063265 [Trifolium repens]|nr:hypothetical protein QL285_063265 [Trifolium repens]